MSSYPLENENEFERLEKQSQQVAYDIKKELEGVTFNKNATVLDAGCGSGLLSRHLVDEHAIKNIFACDFSEIRIAQAKKNSLNYPEINYSISDLTNLKEFDDNQFDYIVCRYVMEHTNRHLDILRSFYRVLKSEGQLILINFDGAFSNIFNGDDKFQSLMNRLLKEPGLDLHIGRKLPSLCKKSGFNKIEWEVDCVSFKSPTLMEEEKENIAARCRFAFPVFERAFGHEDATYFVDKYQSSLNDDATTLFYNKFIIKAQKG